MRLQKFLLLLFSRERATATAAITERISAVKGERVHCAAFPHSLPSLLILRNDSSFLPSLPTSRGPWFLHAILTEESFLFWLYCESLVFLLFALLEQEQFLGLVKFAERNSFACFCTEGLLEFAMAPPRLHIFKMFHGEKLAICVTTLNG